MDCHPCDVAGSLTQRAGVFDSGRVIIESLPSLDVTRLKAGGEAAVWTAPIHGLQRAVLDQACAYGSMCVCECVLLGGPSL